VATWLEKSRSPEYSPAKLSQTLAEVEAVIGISELDEAMAHETIIVGGYLNTHLIKAKSIIAEHMDVDSLSAISADIGNVTSGTLTGAIVRTSSSGDRIQLSDNLLRAYASGTERVRLDTTALRFYDPTGAFGGYIFADTSHDTWSTILSIQPSSTGYLSLHTRGPQTYGSDYAVIQVIPKSGDPDLWHGNRVRLETRGTDVASDYAHVELEDGWVDINASRGLSMHGNAWFYGNLRVDGAITNASINASQLTGTIASARLPTIPSNKLPIRAGSFTITAGSSTSVSFSSSLPSTVRVVANVGGSSSTDYGTLKVYNVSTSGFSATLRGGATQDTITCYYIAVGGF